MKLESTAVQMVYWRDGYDDAVAGIDARPPSWNETFAEAYAMGYAYGIQQR